MGEQSSNLPGQHCRADPGDLAQVSQPPFPTQAQIQGSGWPMPASTPLRTAGAHEGAGSPEPKLQDLHGTGNEGTVERSPSEELELIMWQGPESLSRPTTQCNETLQEKLFGQRGILCDTRKLPK